MIALLRIPNNPRSIQDTAIKADTVVKVERFVRQSILFPFVVLAGK